MRRLRVIRSRLAGLIGACVLLCACAAQPAVPAQPSAAPARGGTVVFALPQEPPTLYTPYATAAVSGLVASVALEPLIGTDKGSYFPVLAKAIPTITNGGVKLSADGRRMDVTYELQSGVHWSDGAPLTSSDVRFTWRAYMTDPKVTTRTGYELIESIDTPSATTAIVRFKQIYPSYVELFYWVLPEHLLAGVADVSKTSYARAPVGTGPFRITEFATGDHITAERNPNYRASDRPYLDRIIFRFTPSVEAGVAQLRAGEVHGMPVNESLVPDLKKDPNIRMLQTGAAIEELVFNLAKPGDPADPRTAHPVLGDLSMRRALLLATPKRLIVERLLFGLATPGTTFLVRGASWAAPSDLTQEDYDPERAKKLLDESGWRPGSDGVRQKGGARASLSIATTSGNRLREQVQQVLVDEWKQIGVEAVIRNQPGSTLFASLCRGGPLARGTFDVVMSAWGTPADPHKDLLDLFHSKSIPTAQNDCTGRNFIRFSDPRVDRLIDEAGSSVDQAKRQQLYRDVLQALNDQVVSIWLYERSSIAAFRASVGGYDSRLTAASENWFVRR